jgi:hypothetical protein
VPLNTSSGLTIGGGLSAGGGLGGAGGLYGSGTGSGGGVVIINPAVLSYVSAVVTAGGTVSAPRQVLLSNMVNSMQSNSPNLWNLMDRVWILAGENTQSALIDLKALTAVTPAGAPTFTASRGYTMNATPGYLATPYSPSANGVQLTLNSAHVSAYINAVGLNSIVGCFDGANDLTMDCPFTDGNLYARINNAPAGGGHLTGVAGGMFIGDRIDSGHTVNAFNGTDIGTDAIASVALTAQPFYIGALNNNGAPASGNTSRYAFVTLGGSLGSPGRANLTTIVTTFLTAIGAN